MLLILMKQKSTTAFFNTQRKFFGPCNLPEKMNTVQFTQINFPNV